MSLGTHKNVSGQITRTNTTINFRRKTINLVFFFFKKTLDATLLRVEILGEILKRTHRKRFSSDGENLTNGALK